MLEKATALLLLPVIIVTVLTGCFDAREIDDEVYAISIGIDKGLKDKLRLTIQYPTYMGPGGSESGGGASEKENKKAQSSSIVHTVEAPTILEAIDMFSTNTSRHVSFIHAKWVIFSEELAREGVDGYIAGFERFRETRPSMSVAVVRGSAEKFITENKAYTGGNISKSVELLLSQSDKTGIFPKVKIVDFHTAIISSYRCPIALYAGINEFNYESNGAKAGNTGRKGLLPGEVPRSGISKRELAGMSVFKGGKMVGYLDAYETAAYLMIVGKYKNGMISIPDKYSPEHNIVFDIHKSRPNKVKAYIKDGKPVIDLTIELETEIYSIQSQINYESLELTHDLESQINDHLLESIRHTINKTQKELKADIFGFGENMAGNFFTIEKWEAYDWLSKYPDAIINLSLDSKIRRTGTVLQNYKKVKNMGGAEK